jgi:hypothetical protein
LESVDGASVPADGRLLKGRLLMQAATTSLSLMTSVFPTHYVVVEGLIGEESIWRVVRAEEIARGRRRYAFVCTCQTRRAALSLARALNEKRAVDASTLRDVAQDEPLSGQFREDPAPDPYRLRPSC